MGKNEAHRQIWEYFLEKVSKFKGVPGIRINMDRVSQTPGLREKCFYLQVKVKKKTMHSWTKERTKGA